MKRLIMFLQIVCILAALIPCAITTESHTVKKGDTLSRIAEYYHTTVEQIMKDNVFILDPNKIQIGWTLEINTPSFIYVVKRGDTLSRIAKKYGKDYRKIQRNNHIPDPNKIYEGQRLRIFRG